MLTQDLIDKTKELVKEGNYDFIAATALGIHPSTFYRWHKRGDDILTKLSVEEDVTETTIENLISHLTEAEKLYVRFALQLKIGEAESEIDDVRVINKGEKDAIPRLAKRSRRSPERWADRRGEDESLKAGIVFLGVLAEALRKPVTPPETPLQLT